MCCVGPKQKGPYPGIGINLVQNFAVRRHLQPVKAGNIGFRRRWRTIGFIINHQHLFDLAEGVVDFDQSVHLPGNGNAIDDTAQGDFRLAIWTKKGAVGRIVQNVEYGVANALHVVGGDTKTWFRQVLTRHLFPIMLGKVRQHFEQSVDKGAAQEARLNSVINGR